MTHRSHHSNTMMQMSKQWIRTCQIWIPVEFGIQRIMGMKSVFSQFITSCFKSYLLITLTSVNKYKRVYPPPKKIFLKIEQRLIWLTCKQIEKFVNTKNFVNIVCTELFFLVCTLYSGHTTKFTHVQTVEMLNNIPLCQQ